MKFTELVGRPNPIVALFHYFNSVDGKWYEQNESGVELTDNNIKPVYPYMVNIESLTDDELASLMEFENYRKREADGVEFVRKISSDLRIAGLRAGEDRNNTKAIQNLLNPIILHLQKGWWISAREDIELIATDTVFTVELKNQIIASMDAYISNNY